MAKTSELSLPRSTVLDQDYEICGAREIGAVNMFLG
jgi:hypothetical protein